MNTQLLTIIAIWGAFVSTVLGLVKIWETFLKDRLRLTTRYAFASEASEITIVNLAAVPVQISHWTLAWKPNLFRWCISTIDVTPQEGMVVFKIDAKGHHTLYFEEDDKFDQSYRSARHRKLYLTLHIFGISRPKVLKVGAGQ